MLNNTDNGNGGGNSGEGYSVRKGTVLIGMLAFQTATRGSQDIMVYLTSPDVIDRAINDGVGYLGVMVDNLNPDWVELVIVDNLTFVGRDEFGMLYTLHLEDGLKYSHSMMDGLYLPTITGLKETFKHEPVSAGVGAGGDADFINTLIESYAKFWARITAPTTGR